MANKNFYMVNKHPINPQIPLGTAHVLAVALFTYKCIATSVYTCNNTKLKFNGRGSLRGGGREGAGPTLICRPLWLTEGLTTSKPV